MRILIGSHAFSPMVGGIESCTLTLAREFAAAGHEVRIVTHSLSTDPADDHGFVVLRRPRGSELLKALRWCEVFFQNNISLQTCWALLLVRRPWFVTTQTWLGGSQQRPGWAGHLKRFVLRAARNLYISEAIARHVGHEGEIVGNPYDADTFRVDPAAERDRDVVFVGRFVSDKGVDLLIAALGILDERGLALSATLIGSGPEEGQLRQRGGVSSLVERIEFAGRLQGSALVRKLNQHRVIAVPSRWNEPFGIVALEGMGCGCLPVVSSGGGLPEASGGHGRVFPNGDAAALATALAEAVAEAAEGVPDYGVHLDRFHPRTVADSYLKQFRAVLYPGMAPALLINEGPRPSDS